MAPFSRLRFVLAGAVWALAVFFAVGLQWVEGQAGYAGLSARFLPTLVAVGLALCGLSLLFSPKALDLSEQERQDQPSGAAQWQSFGWVVTALLLHLSLIGYIGFIAASALLMALICKGFGSKQLARNALIGAAIAIPVWLVFTKVLNIGLPLMPLLPLSK